MSEDPFLGNLLNCQIQISRHFFQSECAKVRRQKELELEVLTGVIRDWEGDEKISQLGEILHMGSVAVGSDHKDRYFALFPSTLLILSVSSRMSAFIYEVKSKVGVASCLYPE